MNTPANSPDDSANALPVQGAAAPGNPLKKRLCINHSDRPAIGVCVITQQPICAECSTRYEGVNYSKEGLRILQQRRLEAQQGRTPSGRRPRGVISSSASVLLSLVLLLLLYQFYVTMFEQIIDLMQMEF